MKISRDHKFAYELLALARALGKLKLDQSRNMRRRARSLVNRRLKGLRMAVDYVYPTIKKVKKPGFVKHRKLKWADFNHRYLLHGFERCVVSLADISRYKKAGVPVRSYRDPNTGMVSTWVKAWALPMGTEVSISRLREAVRSPNARKALQAEEALRKSAP